MGGFFLINRKIGKENLPFFKERDAVKDIKDFIESDDCLKGRVLILYGIWRTGKTTMMEQVLHSYSGKENYVFIEAEDGDTMRDIKERLLLEEENGVSIVFFDEITKVSNFQSNSSVIPDVFAKDGMRIVLTGTDSLGFQMAANTELFGRIRRISTTHIPFTEHCRVFDTNDIDDYIEYGGLMCRGKEDGSVNDYISALRYLESAVSKNICNSIKKSFRNSHISTLDDREIQYIIEKMVEKYSCALNEKDNIIEDFVKEINAAEDLTHKITTAMVRELERYLMDMDVLSVTSSVDYIYCDDLGWQEMEPQNEYYIVQPAIRFNHLKKMCSSEEKIKGDMAKQIILFDMMHELKDTQYRICKPSFYENKDKLGEYDMLIYDTLSDKYWAFEINYTTAPYYNQHKHLNNEFIREIIDRNYGSRENAAVLYRGASCEDSNDGSLYLNITDFMLAVEKHHDMDKAMSELDLKIIKKT